MIYPDPNLPEGFDANKAANLRVKEANATADKLVSSYQDGYEKFWQPPRVYLDRALTADQVQQMLNADPAGFAEILADGSKFVEFVESAHPGQLPDRYHTAPYPMDGLTITGPIKDDWKEQNE